MTRSRALATCGSTSRLGAAAAWIVAMMLAVVPATAPAVDLTYHVDKNTTGKFK